MSEDTAARVARLVETGEIQTWANGYGTWHARVRNSHAHPMGVARLAIRHELQQRQGQPVALPRVAVVQVTAEHTIFCEVW